MARKPLDQDLYDSVVAEAKRKFAVWPSAYASGWVVKTYKERGGRYAGAGRKERTGLTKWFGEHWVDLSRPIREDGKVVGYEPCGRKRSDDPADYPKCRPARAAMRMSKEEVADAVRRKRRAEASAPARGSRARAPKRVATYRANPEGIDGEALAAWCASNESYAVLDETASAGSSWMAGACVLLAKALVATHPEAQLVGIEVDGDVQHVGALVGDVVYDALGAHDERAWAADWLDYEQLDPRTPARVVSLEGVPASALPDVESPATESDVRLVASALSGARTNPRTGAYRNPRKHPPLTERELADLPRANAFWMDFEIENGPEYLPAAMQDAQWPADRDDVELARAVLAFFYRTAPGNY